MKKWKWLPEVAVLRLHDSQIAINGGAPGVRDDGLLASALSRPQNLAAYETPTVFDLAATHAFGLASNHPFIDGNKRTAFLSALVFLDYNGWELDATEVEAYAAMISLTRKEMSEPAFALWLKSNSIKLKKKDDK